MQAIPQASQAGLERIRALMLHGDLAAAEFAVSEALLEHPRAFELRRLLAGICMQTRREIQAESLLRELVVEQPDDIGAAFGLARLLIKQNRSQGAAAVLRRCFESGHRDAESAIEAIECLDECGRKFDALAIAEMVIAVSPGDPRLRAYAGMLALQTGHFECAREHYLFALENSDQACEWHVPHGLSHAQRYVDATHQDFARFRECLQRADLSDKARSTLLFALGKAYDDVGDYEQAASYFRRANTLARAATRWSRKEWRRSVEAQLGSVPITQCSAATEGFLPIFIVGMPRSGTTLLAELVSRCGRVCNRGELPWLAELARSPGLVTNPTRAALEHAASDYVKRLRQDDADDFCRFLDKQPLNFRYTELALAMFPDAKVIYCVRSPRDTALSLWMQSFAEPVHAYANDFADTMLVMRDCKRLMSRAFELHRDSIYTIRYEDLVRDPDGMLAEVSGWLGLPKPDAQRHANPEAAISTSSLWQARQAIHVRSVNRWRDYLAFVPELSSFAVDDSSFT